LRDYFVGEWCRLAERGTFADAKLTTVFGAAIYTAAGTNPFLLGGNCRVQVVSVPGLSEDGYYWGEVGALNSRFSNESAILAPGAAPKEVSLSERRILGRRRFPIEMMNAEPVYELRIREDVVQEHGRPLDNATVKLGFRCEHQVGRLVIVEVRGSYRDGTIIHASHVELRQRTLAETEFWRDSGQILAGNWEKLHYDSAVQEPTVGR
jgi:hypothetical protein